MLGRNIPLETSAWKMRWTSGKTNLEKCQINRLIGRNLKRYLLLNISFKAAGINI